MTEDFQVFPKALGEPARIGRSPPLPHAGPSKYYLRALKCPLELLINNCRAINVKTKHFPLKNPNFGKCTQFMVLGVILGPQTPP